MRLLMSLLMMTWCFGPLTAQNDTEEARQKRAALLRHLEEASRYAVDKKYQEAEKAYDEILKEYPENLEAHIGKMNVLRGLKKTDEAVAYGKNAGGTSKTETLALHLFSGINHLYAKEFDAALAAFAKGSEQFPDDCYLADYYQGYIHFLNRRYDAAVPFLEKALKGNPDYPETYYLLGDIYLARNDKAKVLTYWNGYMERVAHVGSRYERVSKVVKSLGGH